MAKKITTVSLDEALITELKKISEASTPKVSFSALVEHACRDYAAKVAAPEQVSEPITFKVQ